MRTWEWNKAAGAERAVLRNGEYFRRQLEDQLNQSDRGTAKEIGADVGYRSKSMISNILAGVRIPDFKKAVRIADYFGVEFCEWMLAGRRLVEPSRGLQAIENGNPDLADAIGKLKRVFSGNDEKTQDLVKQSLEVAAAAADLSRGPKKKQLRKQA